MLAVRFRLFGLPARGYDFDNDGLLTGAGDETLTRDPGDGLITGSTLGGVTSAVTYDGFGEPLTDTVTDGATNLYSVGYTRDNLGRITQKTETVNGTTATWLYGYDGDGRLNAVTENGLPVASYGYDQNGNRVSVNAAMIATYDDQDRLLTFGSNSYTYNANGELLTKTNPGGTASYTWDVLGNLQAVKLPSGTAVTYLYDGQNRRVGKEVNGTLTEGFLYDGQLEPVAELDGSGNIVEQFVYGTRPNVPDYIIKAGVEYRVISDQVGSPVLIVNASTGAVAEQVTYDAWGNISSDSNPGFQPFGFAGGLYDLGTGLVHFGARDYDPQTGRWISKDPILFAGAGPNLYAYVVNDPVDLDDQMGLHWEYSQSTGIVTYVSDENGERYSVGSAYSGNGAGLNNPNMADLPNIGPIPVGLYYIGAPETVVTNEGHVLQYALPLTPFSGNEMHGRSGFFWHGPKRNDTGKTSSNGCIVSDRRLRKLVASMRNSPPDDILQVVP
ncbi:MAG TPA: RHS repeat-associated core domain-containing protein [Gammaproteobacteria bacterium]|nr:RHS repeat-associated core domain-containing protein [Gammaproteobacteria bacterium]